MAKKVRHPRRSAQPGIPQSDAGIPTESVVPRAMNEEAGAFSREGIESIIIAILLALLFRAFEAEAFVIPTGSMAHTLQGRHKDVQCPQCGERYRAGASLAKELEAGPVISVTCPMCRFPRAIDRRRANDSSFSGDRILVNKFAYQFGEPKRWDVIVFKYPGNAKQNYIKRLVGLPNESLRVRGGDVFVKSEGAVDFAIVQKPPKVMLKMLQGVHDTDHIPQSLSDAGWPPSWHSTDNSWESSADQRTYAATSAGEIAWLNYRHLPPSRNDWIDIANGSLPTTVHDRPGELISDFYAYNAYRHREAADPGLAQRQDRDREIRASRHWVSDLAVECLAKVESDRGHLLLTLIEGGRKFTCQIDLASGEAVATIDQGNIAFLDSSPAQPTSLTASTAIRGPGQYRLRWSNVDDQLRLWVNGKLASFASNGEHHDGRYASFLPRPTYSEQEPGDLNPVRIGCQDAAVSVSSLRVLRDIYYIAQDYRGEYEYALRPGQRLPANVIQRLFSTPDAWARSELFEFAPLDSRPRYGRNYIEFTLEDGQYFPMGDNSPQSQDARLWSQGTPSLVRAELIKPDACVERELLIGKAFLIYWPHGWYPGIKTPFPFIPNVSRMGRIR